MNVLEDLNVDVSSGIDGTNMVDFVNKVQYSIENGYVEIGFNVALDGSATLSYLVHKDANINQGLTYYTELAIEISYEDRMTSAQVKQYNSQRELFVQRCGQGFADAINDLAGAAAMYNPKTQISNIINEHFEIIIILIMIAALVLAPK